MTSPLAEHHQRLREIDPLLPAATPLTGSAVDLLVVDGGIGAMIRNRPDPASLDATWSAADEYRLTMRVGGPAAIDALLTRSAEIVRAQATPDDPDSEVVVWWPSRDVVATAVFLRHGMSASRVVAVRTPRGGQIPVPGRGVRIAGPDDLDASVALQLAEVRWDQQFGAMAERPSTAEAMRADYAVALARDPSWIWIASLDDMPAGLLRVSPPEHASWIAPVVGRSPVAYLSCLAVDGQQRGTGIGSGLVAVAHAALDAAGVAATLLQYAALNPLAGPFWHRHGYRPLWTAWQTKPASWLR